MVAAMSPPLTPRLAVTGPTGAGKSRLCRLLVERGAELVEADPVGHELLARPAIEDRLVAEFGAAVRAADGGIDRKVLGARVFADPAARQQLDRIMHPPLAAVLGARVAAARARCPDLVILEAAVYFLLPGPPPVDMTVAVTAPPDVRRDRLVGAGLAPDVAASRIAAQAHLEPTWRLADRIIVNDGPPATLAAEAAELWRAFAAPQSRRGRPHA